MVQAGVGDGLPDVLHLLNEIRLQAVSMLVRPDRDG